MPTFGFSERDFGRVARAVRKVEGESQSASPPVTRPPSLLQPLSVTFYNQSSETIPAYGIMRVTDGKFDKSVGSYLLCDKPSSTYAREYVVNDCYPVEMQKWGQCFVSGLVRTVYGTGTPAVGELWGPTESQWYLSKGSAGDGASNTTYTRADWGVVVAGVADATNKILLGQIVPKGRARMCLCQADNTAGDTLDKVDTVTSMDGGWCPTAAATDELSVTSGFETDVNSVGVIVYDEKNNNWRPLDFPCKT